MTRFVHDYLSAGKLGRLHSIHQEHLNLGRTRPLENALWNLGVCDLTVAVHLAGEVPNHVRVTGQRVIQQHVELPMILIVLAEN